MLRILAIPLFICLVTITYAQDSIKKTALKLYPQNKYTHAYKVKKPAFTTPTAVPHAIQSGVIARDTANAPVDKSLKGQYNYLMTKIYHYQQPMLISLWKSAQDTINTNKKNLKDALGKLAVQTKTIDSLKSDAKTKEQTLSDANSKVDEISLLGIPMTKSFYNLLMWGLVIAFGVTAAVVIARSGSYSHEAKYRIKLYNELEEEFKVYKTKANDKEKKLARELQTERNKLDELLGRG